MPAPDFTASDRKGRLVRLTDSDGHWRILAFITPGCPACEETIRTLNSVVEERPELVVLVIGGWAKAANDVYALEQSATMPILTPDSTLAKDIYLVQGVHLSTFLMNRPSFEQKAWSMDGSICNSC